MKLYIKTSIEPYRFLFPIGAILGLLGVSVWLTQSAMTNYAMTIQVHSRLMVGTFLFGFAAGFLMTAIPKMTASFPAKPSEIGIALSLTLANGYLALVSANSLFYFSAAVSILFLITFFLRRFLARTKAVPPFFPFVVFGLVSGTVGALILAITSTIEAAAFWSMFGKKLYFEAMILFLVLGIGSRLIPVISGLGAGADLGRTVIAKNLSLASFLLLGFAFEAASFLTVGGLVKFAVVAWVAWFDWKILAKIKTNSRLALGMRISGLMVLSGMLMSVLQPAIAVHWMHMTYIGGFGLMTFTVASRVTLAHGAYDLSFEAHSRALWISGALVLLAALTRVAAPFAGAGYLSHLIYAAVAWVLAVLVWSSVFLIRIFRKGELGESSCK